MLLWTQQMKYEDIMIYFQYQCLKFCNEYYYHLGLVCHNLIIVLYGITENRLFRQVLKRLIDNVIYLTFTSDTKELNHIGTPLT